MRVIALGLMALAMVACGSAASGAPADTATPAPSPTATPIQMTPTNNEPTPIPTNTLSPTPTNTPISTSQPPHPVDPEAALLARATAATEEMNKLNWLGHYQYMAPSDRADCKSGDYAFEMSNNIYLLRTYGGIGQNPTIFWKLEGVEITSETTGIAFGQVLIDGNVYEISEEEEDGERRIWVIEDGEWWWHIDDPCGKLT